MHSTFPLSVQNPISIFDLVHSLGDCELHGNSFGKTIYTVASPASSQHDSLVFINKPPSEATSSLAIEAAAIVCSSHFSAVATTDHCQIVTDDPLNWFISALNILFNLGHEPHIAPSAIISPHAHIGANVQIGAGVIIEDHCSVGDFTVIGANTVIKQGTIIGKNCFIQSNNVIGSVGLGYHLNKFGDRVFFPHLGNVIIEDGVVIGSSCVIVKGQLIDTSIGSGVRLGNQVNIGHNVSIASNTAISSSSSVAGGAKIGHSCNIAAGVIINAKISIGDHVQIGLGSVVTKSLPSGQSFFGNPAKLLPTMRSF